MQNQKTLISVFEYFLSASAKCLFLQSGMDARLGPYTILGFS